MRGPGLLDHFFSSGTKDERERCVYKAPSSPTILQLDQHNNTLSSTFKQLNDLIMGFFPGNSKPPFAGCCLSVSIVLMLFRPPSDNQKRAARLQQLVDSTANLQTAVIDISTKMDNLNVKYRPTIDQLLHANNMASIDDLIAKAASEMTPHDRAVFESVSVPRSVLVPWHAHCRLM